MPTKKNPFRFSLKFNRKSAIDVTVVKYLNNLQAPASYIARLVYQDLANGNLLDEVQKWDLPDSPGETVPVSKSDVEKTKHEDEKTETEVITSDFESQQDFDTELFFDTAGNFFI